MSSTRLNRFVKVAYHLITPYGHFWSLYIYTHFYMRVYAYIPLARSLNNKYTFRFENHAIGIRTPDTAVSEYPSLERTAERFSFCVQSVFHLFLYFFFFRKHTSTLTTFHGLRTFIRERASGGHARDCTRAFA